MKKKAGSVQVNIRLFIRQLIKMGFQQILLPAVYRLFASGPIRRGSVLLADAHHSRRPFSMLALRRELKRHPSLKVTELYWDTAECGPLENLRHMLHFMKLYAQAENVVICDNFLPVASCNRRKGTRVIQLWHACGALKKFGYDTTEDIPAFYKGEVAKNWDLVTVSAPLSRPHFASAMHVPVSCVVPTGVSRTDLYYRKDFNETCRRQFFKECPEAKGKTVVLWAPTFRGNPGQAQTAGLEAVQRAAKALEKTHYFIIRLHPHAQHHTAGTNCSIPTERLLPAADVLITDYSSVLFDAMIYRMPLVLFVPDLSDYEDKRGFYTDLRKVPAHFAGNEEELTALLSDKEKLTAGVGSAYTQFFEENMSACDGHATDRIIRYLTGETPFPEA